MTTIDVKEQYERTEGMIGEFLDTHDDLDHHDLHTLKELNAKAHYLRDRAITEGVEITPKIPLMPRGVCFYNT